MAVADWRMKRKQSPPCRPTASLLGSSSAKKERVTYVLSSTDENSFDLDIVG